MKPLATWLWALALVLACGGADVARDPAAEEALRGVPALETDQVARLVHDKVNAVRRQNGLAELAWNPELAAVASAYSADMAARGFFAHESPDGDDFGERYRRAGFKCRVPTSDSTYLTGGENLALVHRIAQWRIWDDGRKEPAQIRSAEEVAAEVVNGWWNSPGHRKNMLTPHWKTQGIGVAVTADGRFLVTENFC